MVLAICLHSMSACKTDGFTGAELDRINAGNSSTIMPLFTISVKSDSLLLRKKSRNINVKHIESESMKVLRARMLATVRDTLNLGVGIAAPQVGVNLKVIYVQRFDKDGEPFEVYYNPEIIAYGDSINSGLEGCLSVPNYRANVERSQNIELSYLDSTGKKQTEKINDFTAVIFQHEVDHINGTLYFDHVNSGFDGLSFVDEL